LLLNNWLYFGINLVIVAMCLTITRLSHDF
jgi:hypothetical protein